MGNLTGRRFRVSGFVQGVGFRWSTARLARSLGVRGEVRNRPDGTVEISAVAPPAVLERFRAGLETGMPGRVASIVEDALEPGAPGVRTDAFRIVR